MESAGYRDSTLAVEERVADLLGRMTCSEKLAQTQSRWGFELLVAGATDRMEDMEFSEERCASLIGNGLGHLSRNVGSTNRGPRASAEFANAVQRFLVERTRLGIPAIIHDECLCGMAGRGATQFPMMIGMASSFDPGLVGEMADAIRVEMRAVGSVQGLGPVLDITRDPRWGRCEETFGEDPYLASRMGVAYVRALQGDLLSGVAATAKHFLGYGLAEGGLNHASTHIPTRELYEQVALPFEAAIAEADLASVMNSFSDLDGLPSISRQILTELLRDRLGFKGHTVSDYTALEQLVEWHAVASDRAAAGRIALEAGMDVELPTIACFGDALVKMVEAGLVPEALLDGAVGRVLTTKFRLGLFEDPYVDPMAAERLVASVPHSQLALRLAEKSLVLLKNEGPILPIDPGVRSIAVIGPNAHSLRRQRGVFHYPAQVEIIQAIEQIIAEAATELPGPPVSGGNLSLAGETIFEAIQAAAPAGVVVRHAVGCSVNDRSTDGFAEALEIARGSDIAVLVMGESSGMVPGHTTGEFHDRADVRLPGVQEELIRAVAETGTPVILVLVTGRPPALAEVFGSASGILLAWLPGQEGGRAVANALFGTVNPGAKLPMSLVRAVGQIPVSYNHRSGAGRSFPYGDYVDLEASPLFPFGHGLSYTRFALRGMVVEPLQVLATQSVKVSAEVENVGEREGDEVVQLYIRDLVASVARPVKELRGFQRVTLAPGERRTVEFNLAVAQLAFYDAEMAYVVEPGDFEIALGFSSKDIVATERLEVVGRRHEVDRKVFFSSSSVR